MKIYYTYLLINPLTGQPFYVGKGTGNRMYDHWKKLHSPTHYRIHNNNFLRGTLLAIYEAGLIPIYEKMLITPNEQDALNKEIELIAHYGRRSTNTGILCNLTDGGDIGASAWSKQARNKKRQAELAKQKGKPVAQYTLDGTFIKTFSSSKVASEQVPTANRSYITQCCKNKRVSSGGFLWTYATNAPLKYTKQYYQSVTQLTKQKEIIRTFRSLTEASEFTGISLRAISGCCRHKSKTSGGFIWQYC